MKKYVTLVLLFTSTLSFADNPNWPLELKPGRPQDLTVISAASYQFKGYCVPGAGNVTISFGTLSFVTPCRGSIGAYKHVANVSAEVTTNPIKHCVSQGIVVGRCSLSVSNFLASPSLSFYQSPLMDIDSGNLVSYTVGGDCAPVGANISIDVGAQVGIISGVCDSDHKFILTSDVTAVSDGLGIAVLGTITDGGGSTAVGNTVDKNTGVPTVSIGVAADITSVNVAAYNLSGSCNKNGQAVVVSVGGVSPGVAPLCLGGAWLVVGLDVSAVAEGSVLITADHSDSLGNPAVQATATVFKDTVVPLVAITVANDITLLNVASYSVSGTCSENGETIILNVGGVSPGVAPLCTLGVWSVVGLDVSAAAEGPTLITADHTDGYNTTQATTTVTKDTSPAVVAITTALDITVLNETTYGFSGTCSENGEIVTVTVGGISPVTEPTCVLGVWSVAGIDVSGLAEGAVALTADHVDIFGNAAVQATASVNKDTIFANCQEVATLGALSGTYDLSRTTGAGTYQAHCEIIGVDGWERIIRTTGNNVNFGQTTAAIVSSYAAVGALGDAVFEGFREQTTITKFMLKQGVDRGEYTLSAGTGGATVLSLLTTCKNDVHSAQNDTIHDGVRVIGHTSEYSGQRTGGTAYAGFPYFFVCGVNESFDNDQAVLSFSDSTGSVNAWGDTWRNCGQAGTIWSYWNGDYYIASNFHIGNGFGQCGAGFKSSGAGTYEIYIK